MTFSEFGKVLVRYWVVAILIPIAFGLAAGLYVILSPAMYEARSYVVANDPSGSLTSQNVASVVESYAAELIQQENLTDVTVAKVEEKNASEMNTVSIVVRGNSAEQCVETANGIADQVVSGMDEYFTALRDDFDSQRSSGEEPTPLLEKDDVWWNLNIEQNPLASDTIFKYCSFSPVYSDGAEKTGNSLHKLVIAAIAAGFVVALCALACYAQAKRPLIGSSSESTALGLPVLNFGNAGLGESVKVSLKLLGYDASSRICIIPLSSGYGEQVVRGLQPSAPLVSDHSDMADCSSDEGVESPSLVFCNPLGVDPVAAITASEMDGAIVCARYWRDSRTVLESVIERLGQYKINIIGLVLLD